MKKIYTLFYEFYLRFSKKNILDTIVSILLFVVLLAFLVFMLLKSVSIITNTINMDFKHIVHEVIYFVVLVKVYKILFSYLKSHHINIKYMLEVGIIAPIIEIIFMVDTKEWWVSVIYLFLLMISLFFYFTFYEKIKYSGVNNNNDSL